MIQNSLRSVFPSSTNILPIFLFIIIYTYLKTIWFRIIIYYFINLFVLLPNSIKCFQISIFFVNLSIFFYFLKNSLKNYKKYKILELHNLISQQILENGILPGKSSGSFSLE